VHSHRDKCPPKDKVINSGKGKKQEYDKIKLEELWNSGMTAREVAKELGVPVLARIPIDPKTAALVDKGAIELADDKCVADAVEIISKM
jgi:hypothetical protein